MDCDNEEFDRMYRLVIDPLTLVLAKKAEALSSLWTATELVKVARGTIRVS